MNKTAILAAVFLIGLDIPSPTVARKGQLERRVALPQIYPGLGIADIKLDDPAGEIEKRWANVKPDDVKPSYDKSEYLVLYRNKGMLFVCDGAMNVKRIICKNPALLVKDSGLRVGRTRKDVDKAYAPARTSVATVALKTLPGGPTGYSLMILRESGIAYTIKDDRIQAITVFRPGRTDEKGVISVGDSWAQLLSM